MIDYEHILRCIAREIDRIIYDRNVSRREIVICIPAEIMAGLEAYSRYDISIFVNVDKKARRALFGCDVNVTDGAQVSVGIKVNI